MIPDRVDDTHGAADSPSSHHHRSRHRRHHHSALYYTWIRPYRRELKSFILFCVVVAVAYFAWSMVAAH